MMYVKCLAACPPCKHPWEGALAELPPLVVILLVLSTISSIDVQTQRLLPRLPEHWLPFLGLEHSGNMCP